MRTMTCISRRPRWTHGWSLVAVAWAITAALGVAIAINVTGSNPRSTASATQAARMPGLGWNGDLYPLGPPGFGLAKQMPLAQARAAVGFSVPVPNTSAASRANLTQVWVSSHQLQIAYVFDHGRVDITMAPAQYQNPGVQFRTYVKEKRENPVTAVVRHVNGRPVLVIKPKTNARNHSNPAYVEFDRDGIDINIWSNIYGTGTLLAIARSIL